MPMNWFKACLMAGLVSFLFAGCAYMEGDKEISIVDVFGFEPDSSIGAGGLRRGRGVHPYRTGNCG